MWMGDTKLQGFPWLWSYFFISSPQVQAKHCIARGGAGAGFTSAVKTEMLEPLHFGLSQETASSRAPLDHCPLWQRLVCEMCAHLLLAAGHFFTMEHKCLPSQLSLGLLSAESLLWSKCLCFQTPSRPVYSFSTWLQDESVLAVSKGVNAFSKILSETMRIGGTPNPNILLIYAVELLGNWIFCKGTGFFPLLHCSFFFLEVCSNGMSELFPGAAAV